MGADWTRAADAVIVGSPEADLAVLKAVGMSKASVALGDVLARKTRLQAGQLADPSGPSLGRHLARMVTRLRPAPMGLRVQCPQSEGGPRPHNFRKTQF